MILLANVFYFIQNNFYTFLVLFLLSLTLMVLILLLDILLNNKLSKFINKQKNIKSYSVLIIICLGILNILLIFSGIISIVQTIIKLKKTILDYPLKFYFYYCFSWFVFYSLLFSILFL